MEAVKYFFLFLLLVLPLQAQMISGGCPNDTSACVTVATGGNTYRSNANRAADLLNVLDTGAVCDAVRATGGNAVASNASYGSGFAAADIGKTIRINGAGANGVALSTTIANVAAGVATLTVAPTVNASASTSNAYVMRTRVSGDGVHSYAPADTVTVSGGTKTVAAVGVVDTTTLSGATLSGGTGYNFGDIVPFTAADGTQRGQARIQITSVSGGVPATFIIIDGGSFTSNPTTFNQASTAGTNGTGLTLTSPIYNARDVHLTTPGVYTVTPSNAAATTTSGSGQGLTVDMDYNAGGDYAYGTDNSAAFASAVSASVTAASGDRATIRLPATPCGLASTVVINNNFVGFDGWQPTPRYTGNLPIAASSSIVWLGAQDGTAIQFTAVAGGGNQPLMGNYLRGVTFYGDNVLGIGAQFLSTNTFDVSDIGVQSVTTTGIDVNVISGSLATEKCSQTGTIRRIAGYQQKSAGSLVRLDGNSTCNTSYVRVEDVAANYKNGTPILVLSADHIWIKNVQSNRSPGGLAPGIEVTCAAGGFAGGAIFFDGVTPDKGGMIIRGTETCTAASFADDNKNYDKSNGSPMPFMGVGAGIQNNLETGEPNGLITNGQVYFEGGGTVSTQAPTTSGSTASGSFTMVVTAATNLSVGMVSKGNTSVPDGSTITGISGTTLTLSLATTGTISNGTTETFYSPAKLCPEGGGGLYVDAALRELGYGCAWFPPSSAAGIQLPNTTTAYFVYASAQGSRVTGAASSDGTRNLVRLTLDGTFGFQTGNEVRCFGIEGTTEGNSTSYVPWTGNLVDSTHIDLQGTTFANTYAGGGYCTWFALNPAAQAFTAVTTFHGARLGGVPTMTGNTAFTLVGGIPVNAGGSFPFLNMASNNNSTVGPASWYNRKPKKCSAIVGSDPTTGTTANYVELSTSLRCFFWNWNDYFSPAATAQAPNVILWNIGGVAASDTGGDGCATTAGFGTTSGAGEAIQTAMFGTTKTPSVVSGTKFGTAGNGTTFATVFGKAITGGTCTWDHNYLGITVTNWQ